MIKLSPNKILDGAAAFSTFCYSNTLHMQGVPSSIYPSDARVPGLMPKYGNMRVPNLLLGIKSTEVKRNAKHAEPSPAAPFPLLLTTAAYCELGDISLPWFSQRCDLPRTSIASPPSPKTQSNEKLSHRYAPSAFVRADTNM